MSVCLNLIVKNEAHVIKRCLDSIKDYIDCWCICDTGSTDGTQEIIKEYLKNIPGKLLQHDWVDFSTNRNMALTAAKEMADYVLLIDADDKFIVTDPNVFKNITASNYYITINNANLKYKRVQLIAKHSDAHYVGVLHEVIITNYHVSMLNGIEIETFREGARTQNPKKYQEDAALLQKEYDKDPTNSRTAFYLAQSYRDSNELKKAIYYYKQRILLGGWEEELYYSQYQIAKCAEALGQYEEAILNYLKAYDIRPTRAEVLFKLAVLYRQLGKYNLGYLFAKKGTQTPLPTDILFVENNIYEYLMLFELSIHEYWVGKYEDAISSCKKLMEIPNVPESILNQNRINIQFSINKLKK